MAFRKPDKNIKLMGLQQLQKYSCDKKLSYLS